MGNSPFMRNIIFLLLIVIGCSTSQKRNPYESLLDYEGTYAYTGQSTLSLQVSAFDTTLYAVIEGAKYPLQYISKDSFLNNQQAPVVFLRHENEVTGYQVGGQTFKRLGADFEKLEFLPRRALFGKAESYRYQMPPELDDGLVVGDIHEAVDNPALLFNMIEQTIAGTYPDVHSILIFKDDKLILEEYFYGHSARTPHQLRSATKPFIGALVGIAIDKGFISSEKTPLIPYFQSHYGEIAHLDERKKRITIADFLMYRHGMDCINNDSNSTGNEERMMQAEDWVKHTLDLPMVMEPGTTSSYCSGSAYTLGKLVEITTGRQIEAFAKEYLFDPMGITNYHWRFSPDPSSINSFCQMYLGSRDLIKLASMYMHEGKWNGQQILSPGWVEQTFDMETGDYGYLWEHKYFTINGKQYNSYLASGNGGQKINIWPEMNMITVFTGANYNSYQLYGKSSPPNEMIPSYILPAFE